MKRYTIDEFGCYDSIGFNGGQQTMISQTMIEKLNSYEEHTTTLQAQLDEYKAHVAELKEAITPQIIDWCRCGMATNGRTNQDGPRETFANLITVINETPAQSLAAVQAKAIHNAIDKCRVAIIKDGLKWLCRVVDLEDHANNLINQPTEN